MPSVIRQYLRKDRTPFGLLICVKHPISCKLKFGISVCNKLDNFTKKEAYRIACSRLNNNNISIPYKVDKTILVDFILRCKKYFRCDDKSQKIEFKEKLIN